MPSNPISVRSFFILLIPLISIFLGYLFRNKEMSNDSGRQVLPTNVKPYHYDLSLTPNLEAFTFKGTVKINLSVKEDTNTITLNAQELTFNSAKLYSSVFKTESSQTATDIAYDNKAYTATLQFPQTVSAHSDVILEIDFTGILNDQMAGFYRSSYQDTEGNTKYLATTQFEPTSARRAFPCWDEPSLKTTFDVTLVVPAELVALSNMNVISEKPTKDFGSVGEWKEVKYAKTPVMSTYLVAFVVGPFKYIEANTTGEHNGSPVQVRVYTLPGVLEQGRFALGVCTQALEYFAEVFGIPYPLPKMDLVAIPDFEAGAMENWGLVTYRNIALLFDEKSSSIAFKKQVAYTVCHELAHQWFGNLVTMEWWDHLWLNEGFATWVGWLAVDNLYPEWDVWTSFVIGDMPRALSLDALRSSHPIEVAVRDPSEIHQIFDAISYYKGASVIRMLSSWLGVDVFLAGVRRYLHRHKFGNASTGDLWRALGEEAGVDVGGFMNLWTREIGYPVLNLQTTDSGEIHITQSRYLSTGDLKPEDDSTNWWVPLSVLTPSTSADDEALTLTGKSQTFKLRADSLFKLNAGQTGVYRVNYPVDILLRLGEEAKKGKQGLLKNTSDRVGLVADAGSLSVSGEQKTSAFLELVRQFENEEDYFVWSQISTHLSSILSAFYQQPSHVTAALRALQRHLFSPLAHKLGWEFPAEEDYLTTMLRIVAITNAARGSDSNTIREAQDRFWRFVRDGDHAAVHPNLRGAVYETVLHQAKDEAEETAVWDAIFGVYKNTNLPTDQNLIALNGLGEVRSPTLARRLLELSLDTDQIRGQDVIFVWRAVGVNIHTRDIAWDFFSTNLSTLHERFAGSMNLFGSIVKSAIDGFSDYTRIDQIETFFEGKDTHEYDRPLRQAIEAARVNAKWVARDKADVEAWAEKINALGW